MLNRWTGRWGAAALAVTDEFRESTAGPTTAHATTVRHGIDVAATATAVEHRSEIRDELGLGLDEFVIGTAANFRPQKDYPNLFGRPTSWQSVTSPRGSSRSDRARRRPRCGRWSRSSASPTGSC